MSDSNLYNILISSGMALLGVIIGVVITSTVNWKIKSKEARLRILEKVFDERLKAHQNLLQSLKFMRTTISSEKLDEKNFIITYSALLTNKDTFEDFIYRFYQSFGMDSHWFDRDLYKEMVYAQSYFQNVQLLLSEIDEKNFIELAIILKNDFKKISQTLEEETLKFLHLDINKMISKPDNLPKEYSNFETLDKFHETDLFVQSDKIDNLKIHSI